MATTLPKYHHVLQQAIQAAAICHGGVYRKSVVGGTLLPYISHPIRVMTMVWKWGAGKPHNLIASVGHDLEEDCDLTEEDIISKFQPIDSFTTDKELFAIWQPEMLALLKKAAGIITELSFIPPSGLSNREQAQLKDEYLKGFQTKSVDALVIKLADRFCNSLDFKLTEGAYAQKYFMKALPVFHAFYTRKQEIEEAFGKETYIKIEATKNAVQDIVADNSNAAQLKASMF